MTKFILKSGFQFGGMLSTEQLATAFLFMMAIVIMYNQRIKYPEMLVEAGCIAENTGTVDVCFNTLLESPTSWKTSSLLPRHIR